MTETVDPAKASKYVATERAAIGQLQAIADWAQSNADDAWRDLHTRESQLSEMLRVLSERGWTPENGESS